MRQTTDTIERAFQLAAFSQGLDEIRAKLKTEGYSNVDAHLTGRQIRAELTQTIRRNA